MYFGLNVPSTSAPDDRLLISMVRVSKNNKEECDKENAIMLAAAHS